MSNIRLHTSNIRVHRVTYESNTSTYEQHTGNIRTHTDKRVKKESKNVRLETGTPGIQGTGTPTQRKEELMKVRRLTVCVLSRYEAGNYSIKRI